MLNVFRIIIAGSLLFGSTLINATARATTASRALPRAEQPMQGEPCRPTWPYVVRICAA